MLAAARSLLTRHPVISRSHHSADIFRRHVATIAPVSCTSAAFTPDAPTLVSGYTRSPPWFRCGGRSLSLLPQGIRIPVPSAGRRNGNGPTNLLRQIVPHHDVDSDLFLLAQNRLTPGQREQHS